MKPLTRLITVSVALAALVAFLPLAIVFPEHAPVLLKIQTSAACFLSTSFFCWVALFLGWIAREIGKGSPPHHYQGDFKWTTPQKHTDP